ncbi:hypothetical protein ACSCB1_35295 [Streptomyces europaeiscabiei]|uniref:hypothetical protein n=1 Tax=Streptomyces europaeiscabiei TaxID=146819 RepID=UPI000A992F1F|nr:hypothetical protein [Streptomyces europaeiscabiei]
MTKSTKTQTDDPKQAPAVGTEPIAKTDDIWKQLRAPFSPESVGALPKVTCWACTDATKSRKGKSCGQHKVVKCEGCGNYMTTAHVHLDYVGHANVTDRLNTVVGPDGWNWEPLSVDQNGLPRTDTRGNLWIKLTIRNVTKLGYGDGSSSPKELIGDAIRNAAMRFGVALDLWSKDELESTIADSSKANVKPTATMPPPPDDTSEVVHEVDSNAPTPPPKAHAGKDATPEQKKLIVTLLHKRGITNNRMVATVQNEYGVDMTHNLTQGIAYYVAANLYRELKTAAEQR